MELDQRNLLMGQLDGFALKHRGTDRKQLLETLRNVLSAASWKALAEEANKTGGAWAGEECMEWLCGYADFARHHGLGNGSKQLELELREELDPYYPSHIWSSPPARKAYALIPIEWSLLGSLEGCSLTYLLDDTPGSGTLSRWATGRLLNPELAGAWSGAPSTRPLFGFCGQLPGVSKQGLLCEQGRGLEGSRGEVLGRSQADDPDEYPRGAASRAPRDEYLVQIRHGVSSEVTALLDAKVVLDAAVLLGGDEGGDAGWTTLEGFGPGSVPGYTKGGRGVVLMRSGQLKVSSVEALRELGVTCEPLPHA